VKTEKNEENTSRRGAEDAEGRGKMKKIPHAEAQRTQREEGRGFLFESVAG